MVNLTVHVTLGGNPVSGATIFVADQFENIFCQGNTDSLGNFSCAGLAVGEAILVFAQDPVSLLAGDGFFPIVDQGGGEMLFELALN